VATPLDVQRFRPNLLVEAAGDSPYAEDTWVGCVLRVGSLRLRVDKRRPLRGDHHRPRHRRTQPCDPAHGSQRAAEPSSSTLSKPSS